MKQMDDLISRQAAIDAAIEAADEWDGGCNRSRAEIIAKALEQLPPVSTEKTGRWKKIESGDKAFPESIVCSRCGCENSYISEWDEHNNPLSKAFKTTKYCPNCGCKMELWNGN